LFLIQGPVRNSDSSMKTLFIGEEESAYMFADRAYSKIEKIVSLTQLKQSQISSLRLPATEIAAARIDPSFMGKFQKQNYLILPNVSFSLDLCASIPSLIRRMSRRRRRDIKRVKELSYSYSINRKDEGDLSFFYREMYLPYALKRFEKAAHIKTYLESKTVYNANGGILFLKKKDKPIAGILFQIRGKELCASSFGVYNGDESYLQGLASQATLFFLLEWAKTQGMKNLDYGVCSPFLRGGLFTFKKEWGMNIAKPIGYSVLALKISSLSEGCLSFLEQNPFIVLDKKKLKGIVFKNHKLTQSEFQEECSKYYLPGLDSLIVVSYYKPNEVAQGKNQISNVAQGFPYVIEPLLDISHGLRTKGFEVEIAEFKGSECRALTCQTSGDQE